MSGFHDTRQRFAGRINTTPFFLKGNLHNALILSLLLSTVDSCSEIIVFRITKIKLITL